MGFFSAEACFCKSLANGFLSFCSSLAPLLVLILLGLEDVSQLWFHLLVFAGIRLGFC